MKDFLGRELTEGDHVVYHSSGRYGDLSKAIISGFTPKMVRLGEYGRRCIPANLIKYNPEDT